jgi:hypothetical protein
MDISTFSNPLSTWLTESLAFVSSHEAVFISIGAVLPLLIALIARDLLTAVWAGLFALGAVSVCAMYRVDYAILTTFAATAALCLALSTAIRERQRREEFRMLRTRISTLEALEQRRMMELLNKPTATTADRPGLLPTAEHAYDSRTELPKTMSPSTTGPEITPGTL